MAAVIDFYDRRAVHRVISDPSAFDRILDVDALAQEAIVACHNAHFKALGTGDEALINTIRLIGSKVTHIRQIAQEGAALVSESMVVDPYLAAQFARTPDDAA